MRKTKYLIFLSLLFFLGLDNTYATCTKEEEKEFKRIKNNYTVKYEFDKTTKTYTLHFNNPDKSRFGYVLYIVGDLNCTVNDNITTCPEFESGDYVFDIVGKTTTCNDTLKTINLHLPRYNAYSEDLLCQGLEDFYLCDPTYEKDIDRETFESRIANYKKQLSNKEQEEPKEDKQNKTITSIKNFITNNLTSIIVITSFIILLTITVVMTIKSSRKSRWLE